MNEQPPPREAAEALAEIRQRQEQVIERALTPNWFWWTIGLLVVGFSTAVETGNGLVIAIGTTLFVLGNCAAVGVVVVRAVRQPRARSTLVGNAGALAIAVFVLGVMAVTLPATFAFQSLGTPYPATWGAIVCAVLMGVGGPILMRHVRTRMLDRAGTGTR